MPPGQSHRPRYVAHPDARGRCEAIVLQWAQKPSRPMSGSVRAHLSPGDQFERRWTCRLPCGDTSTVLNVTPL